MSDVESSGAVRRSPHGLSPHAAEAALLVEELEALVGLGRQLSAHEWDVASECPGWTVRDLYSHVIGTERLLLGDPAPAEPDPPPAHVRNAIGAANEAWVAARRGQPGDVVVDELAEVAGRRLRQLQAMAPEDFDRIGWSPIGQVPYREFMAVRVMDCWVHEQDVRVALQRPGHCSGSVPDLAMRRIVAGLPFVVAKKAQAAEGSRVRFDAAGGTPVHLDVVVEGGRGRPQVPRPGDGGQPTVTLAMDPSSLWRLACGRISAAEARRDGLVQMSGDLELGGQVLATMSFMI